MKNKMVAAVVALVALTGFGYDIHLKSLTPVKELARPAGAEMRFVEKGGLNFAIALDPQAETRAKNRSKKSIAPALVHLTNAIFRTTGQLPAVIDENDAAALAKWKYLLVLGDSKLARAAGVDVSKMPTEGFAVKTFEKGVVIAGADTSLIEGYNMGVTDTWGTGCGTKWGVLDFCERVLGCRWYFPGPRGESYPEVRDLAISPVHYEDAPYFLRRGGHWFTIESFYDEARTAYWRKYLGDTIKVRDISYIDHWRTGATWPGGGSHCPHPRPYAKAHPDKLKTIFYTDPYGHFWHEPNAHVGNYYNVLDLGFADLLIEDLRAFYASKGSKDPGGFWGNVNDMYVSFGVCDTYLPVTTMLNDPTVKKLGLISEADLKRENDAVTANVYGRFIQYFANRIGKEFPGKQLNLLAYYNTKCAPTDPRWKVPENVAIFLCDGRLPRKVRSKKYMDRSRALFKEWYDARGGKPAEQVWLYTSNDNPFQRAMIPEFSGEIVKELGPYLGRVGKFYDFGAPYKDLWHYWYSAYAQYRTEWNPDFPVDAAIDEAFDLMFGEKAGAHMKAFHRVQKEAYLKYALETDVLSPVYPPAMINEMERELKAAGEAVKGDALREIRYKLIADLWWPAFELQRAQASYEPPVYEVGRLLDGETVTLDGDGGEAAWNRVKPQPLLNTRDGGPVKTALDVRWLWDDKGVYGRIRGDFKALADARPEADLWANDSVEIFFSPGLKKEEYHQIVFDFGGHSYTGYQKLAPIVQPVDLNWKAEGFRHAEKLGANGWTCEVFVPFSALRAGAAPKPYDDWNFNFVFNRKSMSEPRDYIGSALTMRLNTNLAMYGILRFNGKGD